MEVPGWVAACARGADQEPPFLVAFRLGELARRPSLRNYFSPSSWYVLNGDLLPPEPRDHCIRALQLLIEP